MARSDPARIEDVWQVSEPRSGAPARHFPCNTPLDWRSIQQRLAEPLVLPSEIGLHIFRHGETWANHLGLITGAKDIPLDPKGRQQAVSLGLQLDKRYDLVFSSSLSRSRDTLVLALTSGAVSFQEMFIDSRLDERSLGVLEGEPARPLDPYARGELGFAPLQGDSYETVALRILSFLLDLADYSASRGACRVAVSTHMGPLRILVGIIDNESDPAHVLSRKFDNASVLRLTWTRLVLPPFLRQQ